MGKRLRGFTIKTRVSTIFRRIFRQKRFLTGHRRLNPVQSTRFRPFSRLMSWTHRLRAKAEGIVSGNRYLRVGQEPVLDKPVHVPKGRMAVYVGQKDGDYERILVPVVYFNHPLFGDLLAKSENEYGFNHPGGITIPCRVSEFERVQTRIEAVQCNRKLQTWRRSNRHLAMF